MLEICKYTLFLHKNSLNWLMDKRQRLGVIRRLIESERISSQEQLLEALGKNGVSVNQSTLSRDLHFLNIISTLKCYLVLLYYRNYLVCKVNQKFCLQSQ